MHGELSILRSWEISLPMAFDTASGATFSSEGILGAVQKALAQALA